MIERRHELVRLLTATFTLYGKEFDPTVVELWDNALAQYSPEEIRIAFSAHIGDAKAGKFLPRPADIIERVEITRETPATRWPTADEAWAMCPHDEDDTVVWTQEMAEAHALASELEPDRIAMRRAFIDAYNARVQRAKADGRGQKWFVSPGRNAQRREDVVRAALRTGLITLGMAKQFFPAILRDDTPALEHARNTGNAVRVGALLPGKTNGHDQEKQQV